MNTNKSCYDQDKTRQDFNQKKELYYKQPNSSSCHSDRSQNYQRKQVYSNKSNVQYHRQDGNRGQGNYNQGSEALTPDVINGSDHFRDRGATQAIRNKSKLKSSGKYENRECGNATRSTSKWRDSPLPHDSQTIPHRTSHTSDSKTIRHQQGWKSSILPHDSGQSWDNDCQAIPHRKSSSTSLGHVETTDGQERYTYINYMSPVENTAPHESSESWDEVSEKIAIGKYNDDDCDEYSEAVADNKSSIKEAEGSKLNLKAKEFVPTIEKQQQSRPINEKKGLEENNVQSEWSDNYSENVNEGYMNPIPQKYTRRVQSLGLQSDTNRQCHTFDRKDTHSKRFSAGDASIAKEGLLSSRKQWDDSRIRNKEIFGRYTENVDAEYKEFQLEKRKKSEPQFIKVNEIEHDLFAMPKEYSLAHCVAEDMRMGSGIAVNFKRDFKDLDVLLNQRQKQGGLAILDREDRYIYYLVTKPKSIGKPTYGTLWSSLKKMRDHIKQHNVEKLAIPRLGCGLDRLEWCEVKLMLEFLFKEIPLEITVCNFQQNYGQSKQKLQTKSTTKLKKSKVNKKKK